MDDKVIEALKRYNMVEVTRRGETESEMREAKNGEWVRFDDIEAWNHRPTAVVSREALRDRLGVPDGFTFALARMSPEFVAYLDRLEDCALQLPAPHPVSTGDVDSLREAFQAGEFAMGTKLVLSTTGLDREGPKTFEDYLASRPPVQAPVVGVPGVEFTQAVSHMCALSNAVSMAVRSPSSRGEKWIKEKIRDLYDQQCVVEALLQRQGGQG